MKLLLEFLDVTCAKLTQNHFQRAIQLAACTAYCVAGQLRQAFIEAGLEPSSRFVQLCHAAVKIGDLFLQTRRFHRDRRLNLFQFLTAGIMYFTQAMLHNSQQVVTQPLEAVACVDDMLVKFSQPTIQMLPQILNDIGRKSLSSLLYRLQIQGDPPQKFFMSIRCLLVDGYFRRFKYLFGLLPRLLQDLRS